MNPFAEIDWLEADLALYKRQGQKKASARHMQVVVQDGLLYINCYWSDNPMVEMQPAEGESNFVTLIQTVIAQVAALYPKVVVAILEEPLKTVTDLVKRFAGIVGDAGSQIVAPLEEALLTLQADPVAV